MRPSTPIIINTFTQKCPVEVASRQKYLALKYDSYKAASKFYAKYDATMYSQKSKPYDFINLVLRLPKFPNQYSTKVTCGY